MQLPTNLKTLAEELGVTPAQVGHGLWAHVVSYTPQLAASMLDNRNPNNRKADKKAIGRLTSAMCVAQFVLSGETVIFGLDANICDGQQRLSAIVRSQTTQPILTVFGVDHVRAFPVIDHGKGRSLTDTLYLQNKGRKNLGVVAATIRAAWSICAGEESRCGSFLQDSAPTDQQLLDFYAGHPDLDACIDMIKGPARCATFEPARGFCGALLWVTSRIDHRLAHAMFQNMADASMPKEDRWEGPRKFAKRVAIKDEEQNGMDRQQYRALLVKAWGHYFNNEAPQNLTWIRTKEPFPQIAGLGYDDQGVPNDPRLKPIRRVKR